MKIKNKLIAGGLMSVVACALVGSITGTFAWYQYSTKATVSMHGVSVGTTQNLQIKLKDEDWATKNLTWNDIKADLNKGAKRSETGENQDNPVLLAPVTNGKNDGSSKLNDNWYANPNGGESLPLVKSGDEGYLQFDFYARLVEDTGSGTPTPVAGNLYITHIVGEILKNSNENEKLQAALRMHVQLGDGSSASYFLVNPADVNADSVDLYAELDYVRKYDWETGNGEKVVYSFPENAANATVAEKLVSLKHEDVIASDTNGVLSSSVYGSLPADANGLHIVVTVWLEGFKALAEQDDPTTADTTDKRTSNWWDLAANVDNDIHVGFEMTAVKNAA